jgi:hypothetical protein
MAEKSTWWTTGSTGDGTTEYTQAEVIRVWRQQWLGDNTDEGVHKGYQNELEVTGTASPVSINTGAALVYGFPYWNTAAVTKAIATPAGSTRVDRIILRANWTAQTVRIEVLTGTEGVPTPPALTQSDGVTWEISLAEASITTGGVITVTDLREWLHPNIDVDENMLDAGAIGDGLDGGDGTILSVDVSDFAGTGLEDDGSENLRIAAAAAGDGLAGGAGSALSVNVDDTTIETSADTLQVKDDGIDDGKIGNRVLGLTERRGGSSTIWKTPGTTDYTPTNVRMCCGVHTVTVLDGNASHSETITFPFTFAYQPVVLVTASDGAFTPSAQIPIAGISQNQVNTNSFVVAVTRRNPSSTGGTQDVIVHWAAFGPE